jgi:hypothetical protein
MSSLTRWQRVFPGIVLLTVITAAIFSAPAQAQSVARENYGMIVL